MKWVAVTAMLGSAIVATQAEAKGCIKGALIGGIAGHYAGHHGLIGAAAGCAIGRHRANQKTRMDQQQNDPDGSPAQ